MPLSKSEKGKIAEMLIAVAAVLQSQGGLRIRLPLVDDSGDDLHVTDKRTRKASPLQVKSAYTAISHGFRVDVRKKTLGNDPSKLLVFVYCNAEKGQLGEKLWLMRVTTFRSKFRKAKKGRDRFIFRSSFDADDKWKQYRIDLNDLGSKLRNYINAE
jgi:hypothetical protein